jgi:hypothetical protein
MLSECILKSFDSVPVPVSDSTSADTSTLKRQFKNRTFSQVLFINVIGTINHNVLGIIGRRTAGAWI